MVYIVTPVYNRKKFTKNYLNALSKQTYQCFQTIIVDDGSTDGTREMIQTDFPEVTYIRGNGNLWWAEGTNVGVRYALDKNATYILTLNDDTIPEPDFLEKMVYWSKKNPRALLGAFALNAENGQPIFGGEILCWKTGKTQKILEKIPAHLQCGLHEVNIFPGRGLLIPAEVFKKIGFYDSKHFPQTVADIDFTARAVNAGYKIFCNFDARIKIYPEESKGVVLRKQKNLKNFFLHLFGKHGGGNLKWFTIFAFKNAPKKYLISFWCIGVSRRIGGYLYEWIREKVINVK